VVEYEWEAPCAPAGDWLAEALYAQEYAKKDTLTGRLDGVNRVRNAIHNIGVMREVQGIEAKARERNKRIELRRLCNALSQIVPGNEQQANWGTF
jgi:hypothetical protein